MVTHEPYLAEVATRVIRVHDAYHFLDEKREKRGCSKMRRGNRHKRQYTRPLDLFRIKDYFYSGHEVASVEQDAFVLSISEC